VSFFPHKTQNIVHFSLEFSIFTHYLVAAKQIEDQVSANGWEVASFLGFREPRAGYRLWGVLILGLGA
jgi:hypothetical protein